MVTSIQDTLAGCLCGCNTLDHAPKARLFVLVFATLVQLPPCHCNPYHRDQMLYQIFMLRPKWMLSENVPFLLADNHVHSLEEPPLQCKNITVCDIPVQSQSAQSFISEGAGIKQQAINKLLYKQNWIEPTVRLTWGNRTCMCMDSWQHQTQTTKPWVWPQSHQHDWSAVQWRGCLSKETTQDWKQPLLFMSLFGSLCIKDFIHYILLKMGI